jgi:acyl dehydratase
MTTEYLYMEDCKAGDKVTGGPVTVSAEDIIAFARQFDPQDFHTDVEKAQTTVFGGLAASGWHTAALTMRMIVDATPKMNGGMIGRTILNINWPRPVRPGDSLTYEGEILDVRPSEKNPKRGTLRIKNTTRNQNGETVMEMESIVLIPRRG